MESGFLIPLFSALFSVLFYPILILYIALALNLGVFTWLIFTVMLLPYALSWYLVERNHMINYLRLLFDSRNHNRDLNDIFSEYEKLLSERSL